MHSFRSVTGFTINFVPCMCHSGCDHNNPSLPASPPASVALQELLHCQLALTRSLVSHSRSLAQQLSDSITANYHYTTLEDTKKVKYSGTPLIWTPLGLKCPVKACTVFGTAKKVSCLLRCPHFWYVLIKGFHRIYFWIRLGRHKVVSTNLAK